jgi:hypothetical protein
MLLHYISIMEKSTRNNLFNKLTDTTVRFPAHPPAGGDNFIIFAIHQN